jgi:hypothetical protein
MLLILSDLYEEPTKVLEAIGPLRDSGHDVVVMQTLDHAELEFPFDEAATFVDSESQERLPVVPARLRKEYLKMMGDHVANVSRLLGETRIDYATVDTSKPLDAFLFDYLVRRERMRTVR